MKKIIFTLLIAIACSLLSFAGGVFTDVNEADWFASAVDTVYELKYMNGTGEGVFSPKGTVTVGQGITVAARIYADAKGEEIAQKDGEWYQMYVDYAIENKIITDKQFDSYTRPALRHEIATLYASAVDDEKLKAINDVDLIVDVPKDAPYYEDLRMLYNAGILVGNDAMGKFVPNSNISRAEFATMTSRIAKEDQRVEKVFSNVMSVGDSHELIFAEMMSKYKNRIANAWLYDNKNDETNVIGNSTKIIQKEAGETKVGAYRDFDALKDGRLTLEMFFEIKSSSNGLSIGFADVNEKSHIKVTSKDSKFALVGAQDQVGATQVPVAFVGRYLLRMDIDLDKNVATANINGTDMGTVKIDKDISLSRLFVTIEEENKGYCIINQVHLRQNFAVVEKFMSVANMVGIAPYSMDTVGNVKVQEYQYSNKTNDKYSVLVRAEAGTKNSASKIFPAISTDGIYETYILLPKANDGAYFSLYSAGTEVLRIESKDSAWYCGDVKLRDITPNIWQILRIETDYDKKNALIRINGKKTQTISLDAEFINSLTIGFDSAEDAVMWFDDITVQMVVEHDDYPSYPKVVESKDYNIGVHRCDLWRDADSGEGWDSISAFPDLEPVMGYYDEGSIEVADWEIKMMVEHGIDFQNFVLYPPILRADKPIKMQNASHAITAFMNAKYSDLMKFSIIYCCETLQNRHVNFDLFKEYVWPYWVDYYFKDDRYMRIDNKAVFSIIAPDLFIEQMGGVDGAKKCIEFMREDIKKYGYDGMIVLGSWAQNNIFNTIGCDGAYNYNHGTTGYTADYHIDFYEKYRKYRLYAVPTISMGFNHVGREGATDAISERFPVMTPEDHIKTAEYIRDEYLAKNEYGDWKDNTLFVSTWNEYSEGTYVSPAAPHGYAYLETIRKVFTDDKSSHANVDVELTDAQKKRISKMYPDDTQPLRRLMLPEVIDAENAARQKNVVAKWDFLDKNDTGTANWKAMMNCKYSYTPGKPLVVTAVSKDPAIYVENLKYDTKDITFLHVRMKTDVDTKAEVYYRTDKSNSLLDGAEWKQRLTTLGIPSTDEYADYYFPISETTGWKGEMYWLRFDPLGHIGTAEIALIELFTFVDPDVSAIKANKLPMSFDFELKKENGDVRIVANPNRGFFSMLNLYYTWSRFEGKLMVESKDTRAYFTVGSDKVVVNGKEKKLSKKFELLDGLPVFYLKEFCNIFGYEVASDGSGFEITSLKK